MFGRLIGEIVSAPVRVVSAAAKVSTRIVEAACDEKPSPPKRNSLDDVADSISDTVSDTLDYNG